MTFGNVTVAELGKLWTLRAVPATVAATVLCGGGLAALFARLSPVDAGLRVVPYCQIGVIVLGVVTAASEYDGSQIRTTLTSVPHRAMLLGGKLIAYLVVAAGTALATVLAAALGSHGAPVQVWLMLGAAGYLVLIGLLAGAVAVLVRNFVATLVLVLIVVLVVSPALAAVTRLAAYLPDRAGTVLYQSNGILTLVQGAAVLGTWLAMLLSAAAVSFTTRDA